MKLVEANVTTISSATNLIERYGKESVMLSGGIKIIIDNDLFSSRLNRNLLSFKDIRHNGFKIETKDENNVEYLYIASTISCQKYVLEKLTAFSSGMYYAFISPIESNIVIRKKENDPKTFILWHDRLGHPINNDAKDN